MSATKLSAQDAAKIATLARLRLDQDTLERVAGQCSEILGYMDTLAEVDTTGVQPLYSPVEHGTVYRDDAAAKRCRRDDVLANAPETDGAFFIVPKIV